MFSATLFDYNGVLVDDEAVHLDAFRDVLGPIGVALSERDYWDRYLGFDDRGAFEAILRDAGRTPSPDEIDGLIERKRPLYLARAETALRGFPGATDLVIRRATRGPVVIVSGALQDEIELGLQMLGVEKRILGIVSAEDARRSKPDPEGYRMGIALLERRLGPASKWRGVAIEDSLAGVEAAKAAGLACVAVTHSYGSAELSMAGADLIVAELSDITEDALTELHRRIHA